MPDTPALLLASIRKAHAEHEHGQVANLATGYFDARVAEAPDNTKPDLEVLKMLAHGFAHGHKIVDQRLDALEAATAPAQAPPKSPPAPAADPAKPAPRPA